MDSNTINTLGQQKIRGRDLKNMRIKGKITTSVMAEFMGVKSRKTIENWEAEQSTPSINQYILFCKFTGYDPSKVLKKIMLRNASADPNQDIDFRGSEG